MSKIFNYILKTHIGRIITAFVLMNIGLFAMNNMDYTTTIYMVVNYFVLSMSAFLLGYFLYAMVWAVYINPKRERERQEKEKLNNNK